MQTHAPPDPSPAPDLTASGEADRLAALRRYEVLDTPYEAAFDRAVRLAAALFGVPIADVSLVDERRQWLKARIQDGRLWDGRGPDELREAPREWSFCAHAIRADSVTVVPDAHADQRFRDNPFVTGEPRIRFYAGAPLRTPDGHNVGMLCIISPEPRAAFGAEEQQKLQALADIVVSELELRRRRREEAQLLDRVLDGSGDRIEALGLDGRLQSLDAGGRAPVEADGDGAWLGRPWPELWRSEARSRAFAAVTAARAGGTGRFEGQAAAAAGGVPRWWEVTVSPLTGEDGRPERLLAISRDVTQRKRAEACLRASEERLRRSEATLNAVLDALPVGVIVADAQGRVVRDNAAHRELWGVPPETANWEQYGEWVGWWPETGERIKADEWAMARALLRGETATGELVECQPFDGGGRRLFLNNAAPVRDAAGRIVGGVVAELDVTEARRQERAKTEAEQASRAKSRFLAGMSHELRTPLHGILGHAELLRLEGGLSVAQAVHVGAMLGAGRHLLEMINGVLDLSEIEAERVELRPAAVDLRGLATACLDLVRPAAEAKGLALTLEVAPGTPPGTVADPTRLRQVLLNLLGNAAKFTAKGAVGLRLAAAGDWLRIEVADTGPGIPAERRDGLFHDFERLGAEDTAVEGAGLGLALSARLAALLGGRLGHRDNPGGGSVFWLELPLAAPAPAPVRGKPGLLDAAQAAPAAAAVCPLRVLVVDDVTMNRDIAGSFLRAASHEVACAEGGAEAVELAAASDFDVVLMDVRMPGMDGLEATRRIRALVGPRGRVPIVALTAQAFAEQVSECRKAGMDSHLAKPFTPDALRDAVAQAAAAGPAQGDAGQPAAAAGGKPAGAASPANAGPPPLPGSELPVLDPAAFGRIAASLSPQTLVSHLRTIAGRGEALLRALHAPGALAGTGADLAAAAHTLAGSAGMFGFERLADVARRFEHAVEAGAPDAQVLADGLAVAIEASLPEMQARAFGGAAEADSIRKPGDRPVA